MDNSIASLLRRNLYEVFGAGDATRRRAVIDAIFAADAVFYAPDGTYHGREAIDHVAGAVRATHPDFRYAEIADPDVLAEGAGRIRWVAGPPGLPPVYAGTDFVIVREGRIAAVYLFFDPLPA